MTASEIEARRRAVIDQHGPWTAHVQHLGEGVHTYEAGQAGFDAQVAGIGEHLRMVVQTVADVVRRPFRDLRVLDLACLEGGYGLEFARHGSEVVLIEGREANLAKARFAGDVLGLRNVTYLRDDVRNLRAATHGQFDVVLCLGLLYHLNFPDVLHFLDRVSEVCRDAAVFQTQVAIRPDRTVEHAGHAYRGRLIPEHPEGTSDEAKSKALWASLDNNTSLWLSRPSLYNALARVGFTTVLTSQIPAVQRRWTDSDAVVAVKGHPVTLQSLPASNGLPPATMPEESPVGAVADLK